MKKQEIRIDADLCIGCGLCVPACKGSAIQLVNGKAQLVHKDYCDGLVACLPVCPVSAISVEALEGEQQ
ncbi:MAG: 4Fe-4S binding protein [Oscillospiraceae bacterium]|nr:4Fe-4S binding protein [Oscillospiraceae bacterium]